MRAGSNLPAVGGYNQAVILDAVRRAPDGVSRVEVATSTGLSAQTVTNIVRRLLREGLILEAGTKSNGVGKPRTILRLEPRGRFAVGVHLDPSVITLVLLDLEGGVVARRELQTLPSAKAENTLHRIVRAVERLIVKAGVERERVMGIGIAAPGPIDSEAGIVLDPPLLPGWHDVPVRDELAAALRMPVILEKDMTAAVVAELWVDTAGERTDMVFVYFGTGIGAGLVVRGEVIRGVSNNAGDIGWFETGDADEDRGPEEGRSRRWIGNVVRPHFLVDDARRSGLLPPGPEPMTTAQLRDAYAALMAIRDDPRAVLVFDRLVEDVASVVIGLVNVLDVDHVVFGGPFFDPIRSLLLDRVADRVLSSPRLVVPHPVAFTGSGIGTDVAAIGAACLVLENALAPSTQGLLIRR